MSLQEKTATTLKWNTVDRLSTQLLYAAIGVVLANLLTPEEFGLTGALAIFQAFAIIFVDSGFGASLLREKDPTQRDYSTVFWFNLLVSLAVYGLLFVGAPVIARLFDDNERLIPMSKVMFLTFVIQGLAIVQTNRLMKRMEVKMIAVANIISLIAAGGVGVWLAFAGAGAWALVWYAVAQAAIKTIILWLSGGWWPSWCFSAESMRKIRRVGISVFSSSLLNTASQNLYNFVIGIVYGLAPLGIYTQADKYSKMPTASLSQILTSSFVPMLSEAQDRASDFRRYALKSGRFAALVSLPTMTLLAVAAPDIFHLLFAYKWDAAILLFQILCVRGIFLVLSSFYGNILLALGKARHIFASEAVKDSLLFAAIVATLGVGTVSALVWGLLAATVVTWVIQLCLTAHALRPFLRTIPTEDKGCGAYGLLLKPLLPYLLPTAMAAVAAIGAAMLLGGALPEATTTAMTRINAAALLAAKFLAGAALFILLTLPFIRTLNFRRSRCSHGL